MACARPHRPDGAGTDCRDKAKPAGCKAAEVPSAASQSASDKGCGNITGNEGDAQEDPSNPSCCKDKTSACCDSSCLDRIALRECKGMTPLQGNAPLRQESCCPTQRLSFTNRRQSKPRPERRSPSLKKRSSCSTGCCGKSESATNDDRCSTIKKAAAGHRACSNGCDAQSTSDAATDWACHFEKEPINSAAPISGCHDSDRWRNVEQPASATKEGRNSSCSCTSAVTETRSACSTGCCGKAKGTVATKACTPTAGKPSSQSEEIEVIPSTAVADPEKGTFGQEHIILSISGMTCTGCETKLQRTLGNLQSIYNLRTSLVLSRAEFDLDSGVNTLAEVIKYLERSTEFKYTRVTDRGSSVDIIVTDPTEFVKRNWPIAVTNMTIIDEKTVNVTFDAKITGARDLVEHGWDTPLRLTAPRADPTLEAGTKHVRRVGYITLLSIILTIPVLILAWAHLPEREIAYGSASLALATMVQVIVAGPFYPKAVKALIFSRVIEMDLLIVLSTSAAYVFSVVSFGCLVAGHPLSTGLFFETSTLLVTLIMVGRYVAALARQKAVESISLHSLQTPTATLVDDSRASEREVDVRLLQYGDIFKVVPDSKIPTDGTVIAGSSDVNESIATGESTPVEKGVGSAVIAGTVNGSGTLIVRLTRLPVENTISVIANMVDQAKLSKPRIQEIADRVASYFVPIVVALTLITFGIWIAVGLAVRNQSGSRAVTEAITYAITVLIVSCPCAIGLAVPMVVVIASGVAAERGIIFKSADSIEVAWRASHVVFDKTGTLTQAKLTVAVEHIFPATPVSMSLLLGLIGSNKHPISAAVASHLRLKGVSPSTSVSDDAKVLPGKGVESISPGLTLRAGNSRWLNLSSDPRVKSVLDRGYITFCFTINGSLTAVFGLEDRLRPDAVETVTTLQQRGITVHLLSGDDDGPVRSIASQLHIPATNVRSRCTPADKQAYLHSLQATTPPTSHRKNPPVVTIFIGDGTNDAPALAQATVGVHLSQESGTGTGAEVAQSASDVVLTQPSLSRILTMITISRKALHRITFNFGWSFVYNLFAVLLGAGAFATVNARIPPQFAGLGELVSVLPVVIAAVLLRWARF
ncbi:E1-E2 ATPase-domain-containing protein [Aspergillus egyptiacus]|nr:E1-E2 ATPase-domain-containing protein [Aspergillus egyptiacus]